MKKLKNKCNTLFFKTIITIIIGIVCLTCALSALNINASKEVYIKNYVESQEKIFYQIDQDIYNLFSDVAETHAGINGNTALHMFLTKGQWTDRRGEWQNILSMQKSIEQLPLAGYPEMNLVVVGLEERTLNASSSLLVFSGSEFLEMEIVQKALQSPRQLICEYRESGFTNVTQGYGVIVMAKAIWNAASGDVTGVMLLSIKESDFCQRYTHFTGENSEIIIFNQNDEVISSNQKAYLMSDDRAKETVDILKKMKQEDIREMKAGAGRHMKSYMMQRLQSTNYTMLGIIDPSAAFVNVYSYRYIMGVTGVILVVVFVVVFLLVKQQTDPLSKLVRQMEQVRDGKLDQFAEVVGTTEIRELSTTYNTMLVELDNYIKQLMRAEKAKREAELKSLQMQINPHYIYNTLASVKWLIWQGEKDKSVKVIDAFIMLLRNTISNKQDMITLKQEIENLKNYVFINQIRYGSQVNVEYFIMPQFENYMVPKLILQPFVENAFFHAFPNERKGNISIFVKSSPPFLMIEIIDDGVGIDDGRLSDILSGYTPKSDHFTGIGINNVDDRIKLIYGNEYGIDIRSKAGKGTVITVRFPGVFKPVGNQESIEENGWCPGSF